jgi:hypothetical protein
MTDVLQYGDKGERVKLLQRYLNNNAYRRPKRKLVIDGELGPLTVAAIMGTKYWLGYPKEDIEPVAGDMLIGFLKETNPLPGEYRERRKARQQKVKDNRASQDDMDKVRLRALAIIKGELGTLERPSNSNHIKYNDWWGWGPVPYCVIGISWAWVKAGSKAFARGSRWAGCTQMLADARSTEKGIHLTSEPQPGCPGVIDLYGDANPDHAITFIHDNGDGTATTYEFNTSKDSTYIQGVWVKDRALRDIWWFEVEE